MHCRDRQGQPLERVDILFPRIGAALSISFNMPAIVRSPYAWGCHNTTTRERPGTISLSNCSRLDTNSGPRNVVPVTFPPGRARLEASSSSTGSAMPMPIIGIAEVARLAARTAGVLKATMASTRCSTNSCASPLSLFASPSANFRSNAILSFDITKLAQRRHKGVNSCKTCVRFVAAAKRQDAYPRNPGRQLGMRGERPNSRCAAEKSNELAPPHCRSQHPRIDHRRVP